MEIQENPMRPLTLASLRLTFALTLAITALGACASNTLDRRPTGPFKSPTVLSRQDFSGALDGRSIYDVVRSLRPTFLHSRGSDVTVAVDGMLMGSASVLRDITADCVQQVELLNGPEATMRFGARHTGAVLLVTTRRR
jgi:hypothetical protein